MALSLAEEAPVAAAAEDACWRLIGGNHGFTINEADVAALSLLKQERLLAGYIFDNHRMTTEAGLEGAAFVYQPNARIVEGSPLLAAADRLFGVVACARIIDSSKLDDGALRQHFERLMAAAPLAPQRPFSLSEEVLTVRTGEASVTGALDRLVWDASLGHHGHFVGAYREEVSASLPAYWLVVHSDAGHVGRDLITKFVRPALNTMTYYELLNHQAFKEAKLYAQRNANRLLRDAAIALGVTIVHIEDVNARVDGPNDAPAELAVPNIQAT
jgi:hypothetical protein